jgi:hypothetical protein
MTKKTRRPESPITNVIDKACNKFFRTINSSGEYEASDLFGLASCLTYGMHRPRVWYSKKIEQKITLMIEPISAEEIAQQAGIVFSGLSQAHIRICTGCHPSGLKRNNQESVINNILIDLIDHMAVVMDQKSLQESSNHRSSTVKALRSDGFNVDGHILKSEILPAIYSTESCDQKKVFREVLLAYKRLMSKYNPYSIRTAVISRRINLLLEAYVHSPGSPTSVSEIKEETKRCIYSLFNHKMILDEPTLQWLRSGARQDSMLVRG